MGKGNTIPKIGIFRSGTSFGAKCEKRLINLKNLELYFDSVRKKYFSLRQAKNWGISFSWLRSACLGRPRGHRFDSGYSHESIANFGFAF